MLDLPCVIFAGGKSSRMGEDKALLPFGSSKTLTQYQYTRLCKIFKRVYISCKESSKFNFDANFIEDKKSTDTFAPTIGFISIFDALKDDAFFALSVDTPFIDEKIISKLLEEDRKNFDATIAKTDEGLHPMCGIYHRTLESKFIKMQEENNHKLGFLLKNSQTHYLYFNEGDSFLNMNHPNEYQKALSLINY